MKPEFPQRLALPTLPGYLLKRLSGVARQIKIDASDPAYLKMVREMPCLSCGLEPCRISAHVRMNSGLFNKRQAMARKPHSKWCVPLCDDCHTNGELSQHRMGEALFWHRLNLNPLLVCAQLYAQRGDLVAMRAVILKAIAER